MPYFSNYLDGPVHGIFASDALETRNSPSWVNKVPEDPGDPGLEAMTTNHININTGGRIQIAWLSRIGFVESSISFLHCAPSYTDPYLSHFGRHVLPEAL